IWAVDTQNNLFDFDNQTPQTILSGHAITGLAQNEQILQIDFRPVGGALYGLSNFSRLYTLDPTTGAAVGLGSFTPIMNGNHFGFDINPNRDSGQFVSDADQDQELNTTTGATSNVYGALHYAAGDVNQSKNPSVVALGYSNN